MPKGISEEELTQVLSTRIEKVPADKVLVVKQP
jgi:hypothetical protein